MAATPDAPPPAAAPDPAALVATLARPAPDSTPYVEVRFSGLLERPLILTGTLEYRGPGDLAKHVRSPFEEHTAIRDGEAVRRRGDRERRIALGQVPELDAFLRGFSALLGGNAAALSQDFELSAQASGDSWRLHLRPRDRALARRIERIEVDGSGSEPRCLWTLEADGDRSVILLGPLGTLEVPVRASPSWVEARCRGRRAP